MPQRRKTFEEVELMGNPSRLSRDELAARKREAAASEPFGIPEGPTGLDAEEMEAWRVLVDEHRDRLRLSDGRRLSEVARIEVLLNRALRSAKKGSTLRGGKRNPAFSQAGQLVRLRKELLAPILSRQKGGRQVAAEMLRRLDTLLGEKAN